MNLKTSTTTTTMMICWPLENSLIIIFSYFCLSSLQFSTHHFMLIIICIRIFFLCLTLSTFVCAFANLKKIMMNNTLRIFLYLPRSSRTDYEFKEKFIMSFIHISIRSLLTFLLTIFFLTFVCQFEIYFV